MTRFLFRAPNFRCKVSDRDDETGKQRWRLCYAADEEAARALLAEMRMEVHAVEAYDFEEQWLRPAREEARAAIAACEAGEAWEWKPLWRELKEHLFDLSHRTCVYCEAKIKHVDRGDVEHYRPKGRLQDEEHPGYYWLAYDPKNYLPACTLCNQAHKRSYFPIATTGHRAFRPADALEAEEPLLLNPSQDDPREHLAFVPSDKPENPGCAVGRTEKGGETITILRLNRPDLVDVRRQAQAQSRVALKQAQVETWVTMSPEPLRRFVTQVLDGTIEFSTPVMCEVNHCCQAVGVPPLFP